MEGGQFVVRTSTILTVQECGSRHGLAIYRMFRDEQIGGSDVILFSRFAHTGNGSLCR